MTPFTTILTHPGSAHKDELLACCVLLATNPVTIVRREPAEADLADTGTVVVDVGDSHDPALNNFDHHQLPDDAAPTCALSLVLQNLGLYEDAKMFCDWLEPAEWFDCRGANTTAKWLGVKRDIISQLNSPIDITLLRRFAMGTEHKAGEPVWEIMRMVGEDLLDYLRNLRSRLTFVGEHAEVWTLNELADADGNTPQILFMPRTDPLPEEPSSGLDRYVMENDLGEKMIAILAPDRRGTGYGLSKHRDNPRLDFTRITDEADVHFAHLRGFVAKTSATEPKRLRELLKIAGG